MELAISASALVLLVNVFNSVLKRWVYPKFGKFGVQITAFILSTLGSVYFLYGGIYPGLVDLLSATAIVFSTAVAFYEVVLSRIDIFKVTTIEVEEARG